MKAIKGIKRGIPGAVKGIKRFFGMAPKEASGKVGREVIKSGKRGRNLIKKVKPSGLFPPMK